MGSSFFSEAHRKRQELLDYRFGDIHGQHFFSGLDIRNMQERGLRIGLIGLTGSGKSSFINTCERALKPEVRKGTADVQTAGGEGTIILQEYLDDIDNDFRLVDTRGFFRYDFDEFTALTDIVYGRIRPGQVVEFGTKADNKETEQCFSNWLHAIIIVLSATDPRLKGGHSHYLKIVHDLMRPRVVTVITHHDRIKESQEEGILAKACAATGSSRDQTFFVANYHLDKKETDYNNEIKAMDVMKLALKVGERYARIHKLQEQWDREERRGNQAIGSQGMQEEKEMFLRMKKHLEEYQVGSKLRLGKLFPEKIMELEHINIAMVGPTGSGKSSFINIAEQVMMGPGEAAVITQSTGKEGTIYLEEFLTKFNFRLIDTRGYFDLDEGWSQELKNILTGKIHPGQTIVREVDDAALAPEQHLRSDEAPFGEQIHGVICVMVDKDPRFGEYKTRMRSIKEYLREQGYSPVAALAFPDEEDFKDEDRRRFIMEELSAAVGAPIDKTFPFINHLASGSNVNKDPESVLNVLDILDTAVTAAEKFIKVRLQREKTSSKRTRQVKLLT